MKKKKVLLKNLDFVLLSSTKDTPEFLFSNGSKITLNKISTTLWYLCDGTRTFNEVVNVAAAWTGGDKKTLRSALRLLIRNNLVVEVCI